MNTYYVSKSGSDSNNGTSSSPFKSIGQAINKVNAGDTILVKAGTYDRVKIYDKDGTESKPITLAAAPGDEGKVIISGGGYGYDHGGSLAVSIKNSSNIIVENLNLTTALVGIGAADSKNITLQSNKIYDIGQAGIKVSDNSSHVDILNNTISDTGKRIGRWGEGIYLGKGGSAGDRVSNVLIKGNDISQTISEAVDIKPYVSNVIVEDNLIHDMKVEHSGAVVIGLEQSNYSGGRDFSNADNIVVRNNKIWNISAANGKDGHAINASSSTTIYNNVIWNYQNRGIFINRALSNHDFKVYHNTVYPGDKFSSTQSDIYFSEKTSAFNAKVDIQNNIGYEVGNNISGTKELFVDAKNGNFELQSNASAVDAGVNISEVETDLAGSSRIQGNAPDLGAFEYENSSTPVEETPSTPVEEIPSAPVEETPSAPVEETPSAPIEENSARIQDGLQVLYTFDSGGGNQVVDVSKVSNPINLTIDNPQNVAWGDGTLTVEASTLISSQDSATRLNQAIAQSNELTIEAWVISDDENQSGPARMVTLSDSIYDRNFTLGQSHDSYDVRFRTTETGSNGYNLSLSTPTGVVAEDQLTHIVYTRDASGKANLFVDNELVANEQISGDSSNWNLDYELGLANEMSGDRPWTGTYDLVAVYDQALSSEEVTQNFLFGSQVSVV